MIIVIGGATASGKSSLAIKLAKNIGAEIVCGDAFQIYQEMNIGTAQTSEEEFENIPHHLFASVSPNFNYSVANYQNDARKVIDDILSRNKPVIIVGGTGLYIRAALMDYKFDKEINQIDMSNYEEMDNETLHKELEKLDYSESLNIHMNNRKRVLRAIEICLSQGKKKSEIVDEQEHKFIYDDVVIYALDVDREKLYENINKRVDIMFDKGLENEVNYLFNKYGTSCRAFTAIGYKEFLTDEVDKKELIKKNTRNYAKRQITFFKHQFDTKWIKSIEDIKL